MVFAAHEFVLVMVDPVVPVAIGDQAVIGRPGVGVDEAGLEDIPLDDRHQFSARAVFDDTDKDSVSALMKTNDRDLPACGSTALTADSPRSKIALINLDLPAKLLRLFNRQLDDSTPQQRVNSLHRLPSNPKKFRSFQSRQIHAKTLHDPPKYPFIQMRISNVFVFHCPSVGCAYFNLLKRARPLFNLFDLTLGEKQSVYLPYMKSLAGLCRREGLAFFEPK